MPESPTCVQTFGKPEYAELAASMLRAAGIPAVCEGGILAEVHDWALGPGGVEIALLVPAADAQRARLLLAEAGPVTTASASHAAGEAVACLSCGEGISEQEEACSSCGWTWELAGEG